MIEESAPWRVDLRRYATSIEKARATPQRTDSSFARIERDFMYGFFAIRRLVECFKLSTSTAEIPISVVQYPFRTGSRLTILNWSHLDRHYDFERGKSGSLKLRDLSNQVIHSYVFSLAVGRGRHLAGAFISSEYQRRKSLAYLTAWRTSRVFRRVASDWRNTSSAYFDEKRGDFVWQAEMER